jgi:hypothetical protein
VFAFAEEFGREEKMADTARARRDYVKYGG